MITGYRRFYGWAVVLLVLGLLLPVVSLAQEDVFQGDLPFDEVIGAVLREDVVHSYAVQSDGGELITVAISSTDPALDPVVEVFDAVGNLLAYSDDVAVGLTDARVREIELVEAGAYQVVVRSYGNRSAGAYTLEATRRTAATLDAAAPIAFEELIQAELFIPGQVDRWTFDGVTGQTVWIALDHAPGSLLDPLVELFGPDGELLSYSDDDGGDVNALIAGFVLPVDGAYTIAARAWGDSSIGPYELLLTTTPIAVSSDPLPDTLVGYSGPIALGEMVNGNLAGGTTDEWTFTLEAETTVSISMDAANGTLDPYLELVDAAGVVLVSDDDGGGNLDSLIRAETLAPATYIIRAQAFGGSDGGAYRLTLASTQPLSVNTGNIEPGQTVEASLLPGAEDEWTLVVQAGDAYSFGLYAVGDNFDTVLRVTNSSGQEIGYDDDGGLNANSVLSGWVAPADGAYTLLVGSFSSGQGGPYTLTVVRGTQTVVPAAWQQGVLPMGKSILATFPASADPQVWTFDGTVDAFITVTYDSGLNEVWLVGPDGFEVGYLASDQLTRLPQTGQYLLVVHGYPGVDYTLTLNEAPEPTVNSGNIETGQTIAATLAPGATDEWTLVVAEGEPYSIAVIVEGGSFDPTLTVLDAGGRQVNYDDDGGMGTNSALTGWTASPGGPYTFAVTSFNGSTGGDYTITVLPGAQFVLPEGWQQGTLTYDSAVDGSFTADAQAHSWSFEGEAATYIRLDVDAGLSPEVIAADGAEVIGYVEPGQRIELPQTGTYYVLLHGYPGGSYTLTVRLAEPPPSNTGNVEPGQTIAATLAQGGTDRWTYVGQAGDVISVAVYADNAGFDSVLAVSDEAGTEIAMNDDGGMGANSLVRGLTLPADGAFTFQVRGFSDWDEGPYRLTVVTGDEFLLPEGVMQGSIPVDGVVNGSFGANDYTQVWLLEAGSGQSLLLDYDTNQFYTEVMNSNGEYFGEFWPGEALTFSESGVYYLSVTGYEPGAYTFTLSSGLPGK